MRLPFFWFWDARLYDYLFYGSLLWMGSDVPLLFYHNVVTYAVKYGVRSHHNIVTTDSERWHVQLIPFSKKSYRSRIVVQDQKFQKKFVTYTLENTVCMHNQVWPQMAYLRSSRTCQITSPKKSQRRVLASLQVPRQNRQGCPGCQTELENWCKNCNNAQAHNMNLALYVEACICRWSRQTVLESPNYMACQTVSISYGNSLAALPAA